MIRRAVVGVMVAFALAAGSPAHALLISDPYGVSSDVIGDLAHFDIRQIDFTSITASNITAELRFNFQNPTLTSWNFSGVMLEAGDLVFDVGGTYKYGVALTSHDGLTAGHLYSVSPEANFFTSNEKMGSFSGTYRQNQIVQIQSGTDIGTGTVGIEDLAGTEVKVTLNFTPSATFLSDLSTYGLSVHFASATCANDVIDGVIEPVSGLQPVPEPGTLMLLGSGLAGLGAVARRRFLRR